MAADKALAKHALRDAGLPTPDFFAFSETAFRELGAAGRCPRSRRGWPSPSWSSRPTQGSALGIRVARTPDDVPAALMTAFSYDRKVVLERHVPGRELAVSVVGGEPLPVVEAVVGEGDLYDFEARYEIGRTTFVCPAELEPAVAERVTEVALGTWTTLG